MGFEVRSKVAVITGGSSGIGRGIALAFARAGAQVVVLGRSAEHLAETEKLFADLKLPVRVLQVDVTDLAAMHSAANYVSTEYGRIDVLVNNAGIGLTGPVMQATPDDWNWVIDVNVRGVGNGIMAFVPQIQAHGNGGAVVNTSSMGGLLPVVAGLYSMTKAAVIALSEALHIELLDENISVAAYCPGPVHSNIALAVRKRPESYGASGYAVPPASFAVASKAEPYMTPEEAGERVLRGVERGDMFITTHPEFLAGLRERHSSIEASFPEEPINDVRAAAIPFLTGHDVYSSRPQG